MRYRHTQFSTWTAIAAAVVALAAIIPIAVGSDTLGLWWLLLMAFVAVSLATVSRLTVTVDDAAVHAALGLGWPSRRIALTDIAGCEETPVRWYHGWGIRKVAKGWMFNVSGYVAVALSLRSGAAFWIGTDDPDRLIAAIESASR